MAPTDWSPLVIAMSLASASDTARALDSGASRRHFSSMNKLETQEKDKFLGSVQKR
jgi:hypothetical protein